MSKILRDVLRLLALAPGPRKGMSPATLPSIATRYGTPATLTGGNAGGAGYHESWLRQLPLTYTAEIVEGDASTRLEWVVDSGVHFFPTVRDQDFGYMLLPVDLARNKVMAAAGRREVRDLVDLITIHDTILSLGALIWAAVGKS